MKRFTAQCPGRKPRVGRVSGGVMIFVKNDVDPGITKMLPDKKKVSSYF